MAVTYGFYNSVNGDRVYDATQISAMFDGLITDGVIQSQGGVFNVTIDYVNGGMNVTVDTGRAWFNHTWTLNDAPLNLSIEQADLVYTRVDAIFIQVDASDPVRENSIIVVSGTPSSTPIQPTPQHTATLNQYPIAHIIIPPNTTEITGSMIQNMVGSVNCPFVTGVQQGVTVDVFTARWDAQFREWFANLQSNLDGNVAANLQGEIDNLTTSINSLNADLLALQDSISAQIDAGGESSKTGWYFPQGKTWSWIDTVPNGLSLDNDQDLPNLPLGTKITWRNAVNTSALVPLDTSAAVTLGEFTGSTIGSYSWNSGQLVFNGSVGVSITGASLAPFKPTGGFTVGFNLGVSSNPANVPNRVLFSSGIWNDLYGFSVWVSANYIYFKIGNGTTTYTLKSVIPVPYDGGTMSKVVCTFRNGVAKIYINGVKTRAYFGSNISYHSSEHYVRIGCQVTGTGGGASTNFANGCSMSRFFFIGDWAMDEDTIGRFAKPETAHMAYSTYSGHGFAITKQKTYAKSLNLYYGNDQELKYVQATLPTSVGWSTSKSPEGFPTDPEEWDVLFTDSTRRVQATPVNGTWYNLGSLVLDATSKPRYPWNGYLECVVSIAGPATGTTVEVALASDSAGANIIKGVATFQTVSTAFEVPMRIDYRGVQIEMAYIVARVTNASVTSLALENAAHPLKIVLECPYI